MPTKSPAQHKLMEAVAHNSDFAKKVGIPQSGGKEFAAADKAKRAIGGALDVARRAKRDAGGAASSTPWYTRHESENMLRGPVGGGISKTGVSPLITKGNLAAATPLGQALANSPKVSAPKPQFPKLPKPPQMTKPPKLTMKGGGEVDKERTEPFSHGPIIGTSGGTADKVNTKVADNSFIITSRVTAALGDGNTLAGMAKLHRMFPPPKAAKGDNKNGVDVALSDGEVPIHPYWVKKIGNGDYDRGHRILKTFSEHIIHQEIEKLKHLPSPTLDKDS